jgi:hypothetical protein
MISKNLIRESLSTEIYKKYILDAVNELCPAKKKTKFTAEYYLENFIYMLNDLCRWKSLSIIHKTEKKYHWKTIENEFRRWSKLNVFEVAHNRMTEDMVYSKNDSHTTLNLYIDTADINNVSGSELVDYGKNKKKRQTKMSIICDRDRNIYVYDFYKANVADVKTIISSLNKIKGKFKYRKINVVGDKGYVSSEIKKELKKENINLIYPHKKNMKKRTPKRSKKHLKFRYTVEHAIHDNKRNNRISQRKDRLIHTFKSFLCLSIMINLQTSINKKFSQTLDNKKLPQLSANLIQ